MPPYSPPPPTAASAPEIHLAEAHEHFRAGRFQQAIALIERLLQQQPRNPLIWNLAAATARAIGQRQNAETFWKNALTLDPAYAGARYNYGVLLMEDKRFAEAEVQFRRVPEDVPQQVQLFNNLGVTLEGQDRVEEALQYYDRAITSAPNHAKAHHNRGLSLVALGRFEEAQQALERALSLAGDQDKAPFYRSLTTAKRFTSRDDTDLLAMEQLASRIDALTPDHQMQLNFALGKAYADTGEHLRSFRHYLRGNALKRQQIAYDERAALSRMEQIRRCFSSEFMSSLSGAGNPDRTPIFILGMPRSGSTLVEQILSSHPDVYGAGELEYLKEMAEALLFRHPPMEERLGKLTPADARRFGHDYVSALRTRAPAARFITDKRTLNFLYVGLIHLTLPGARIIHTRREAFDSCASCFSHLFRGDFPFAYELGELGRYWRAYDQLMSHWHRVLPPDTILDVQHEQLISNPEQQVRRLLDHCGLEWNEACLDFHRTRRPVRTASALQVRQPLYRKSAHPWRQFESELRPLIDALTSPGPATPG